MKNLLVITLILIPSIAFSQPGLKPDEATLAAMQKLDKLVGHWKGEATFTMGPTTHKVEQVEQVYKKVNGAVLVVDGLGYDITTREIVHEAFASISYDNSQGKYLMRAFRGNGQYVDAHFRVEDDGRIIWGFNHPQAGDVTYIITISGDQWIETGTSKHGNMVIEFLRMNLTRQQGE